MGEIPGFRCGFRLPEMVPGLRFPMSELLTAHQFAARHGVSHTAINRACKSGRITATKGVVNGRECWVIDTAVADEQWAANRTQSPPAGPVAVPAAAFAAAREEDVDGVGSTSMEQRLLLATRREKLQLDLAERKEELVSVSEIEAALAEMVVRVKNKLLLIPDNLEVAPEVRAIVKREIFRAMAELVLEEAA